jgi:hypothetical protein
MGSNFSILLEPIFEKAPLILIIRTYLDIIRAPQVIADTGEK